MGKVTFVRSSRKEWKCQKCGCDIHKGDSYYRGEVNFGPTFIRCEKCKLKPYEVTTSWYIARIGELLDTWQETYSFDQEGVEQLVSDLEDIRTDLECNLEELPEQFQESGPGEIIQGRIDELDQAIADLECIDEDSVKQNCLENCASGNDALEHLLDSDRSCDDIIDMLNSTAKLELAEAIQDAYQDLIDSAFTSISGD